MKKRILSVILVLCLCAVLLPAAFAESMTVKVDTPEKLPAVGESFDVAVSLENNPGVTGVQFYLKYNNNVLECTRNQKGAFVKDMELSFVSTQNGTASVVAASANEAAGDGVLATFTFKVIAEGNPQFSAEGWKFYGANESLLTPTIKMNETLGNGTAAETTEQPSEETETAVEEPTTENETDADNVETTETETEPAGETETGETDVEAFPQSFKDVFPQHWAYDYVERAAKLGLVTGYEDGSFRPETNVTRAEFVVMLWRMAGKPEAKAAADFADVAAGSWYSAAVSWAAEKGIVKGLTETTFCPTAKITRQQVMTILYRYNGGSVEVPADKLFLYGSVFSDYSKVASWAKDGVDWAIYKGIVTGSGNSLNMESNASRAEIATLFMRYVDKFVNTEVM